MNILGARLHAPRSKQVSGEARLEPIGERLRRRERRGQAAGASRVRRARERGGHFGESARVRGEREFVVVGDEEKEGGFGGGGEEDEERESSEDDVRE